MFGPKGHQIELLVLRDKSGKIREIARDDNDKARLTKWYEKYNMKERLERLLETRALKEHVRKVKQRIRRRGFTYQISLYGITKNPKTGVRQYRRYEIFKAYKWTPDEVGFMHDFFKSHVPVSKAGLFIYHEGKLYVDEKDELTKFGRNQSKRTS
jgi:hypothetical protein